MEAYLEQEVGSLQQWFASSGVGITQAMKDRGGYADWKANVLPLVRTYNELLSDAWLNANMSDKGPRLKVDSYQAQMGAQVLPAILQEFPDELVTDFFAEHGQPSSDADEEFFAWVRNKFGAPQELVIPDVVTARLRERSASTLADAPLSERSLAALSAAANKAVSRARQQSGCIRTTSLCRDGDTQASVLRTVEQEFQTVTLPIYHATLDYAQRALQQASGNEEMTEDWLKRVAPSLKQQLNALELIHDALPEGALRSAHARQLSAFEREQGPRMADIYGTNVIEEFRQSDMFVRYGPQSLVEELNKKISWAVCSCSLSISPDAAIATEIQSVRGEHAERYADYVEARADAAESASVAARERERIAAAQRSREAAAQREKDQREAEARAAWAASGQKTPVLFFGIRFNETSKSEATRIFADYVSKVAQGRLINPSGKIGQHSSVSRSGKLELTCWNYYTYETSIKTSCLYFQNGVAVGGRFNMDGGTCSNCNHPNLPDLSGLDFLKSQGFEATESYGPDDLGFPATTASFELNEMTMNWNRALTFTQTVGVSNTYMNILSASICIYPTELEGEFVTRGERCIFRP
ncbi:MAG: hypothetical protein VX593_00025 [Pseudomonadota bacterium]|nr:hypothetical protein [Pseudomonadota bacterium]